MTATIGLVPRRHAIAANRARYDERYGWMMRTSSVTARRLKTSALIDADPSRAPLAKAPQFLRADVVFAVCYEGAPTYGAFLGLPRVRLRP